MTIRQWLIKFAAWQSCHAAVADVAAVDEFLSEMGAHDHRSDGDSPFRRLAADRLAAGVDLWTHRHLIDARSMLADLRLDYGPVMSEEDAEALVISRNGRWVDEGRKK
jgi:hypothetical protein